MSRHPLTLAANETSDQAARLGADTRASPPRAPISVVYIGGAGRSGSTLLSRMLGTVSHLVAVGEVRHLLIRGYLDLPQHVRCGCGAPFARCPFWTAVRAQVAVELPDLRAGEAAALARRVDRIRYLPGIYSPWRTRRLTTDARRFSTVMVALYRAILAVSGASTVIDDSKDLSLLYFLARCPEIQLSVIHLVRDSRGMAYSWTRPKRELELVDGESYMDRYALAYSAYDWCYRNVGVELARPLVGRYLRVRYEDLIQQPERELDRLLDALDCSARVASLRDGRIVLQGDHVAYGNPSRFHHGAVALRLDEAWRDGLSPGRRLWVTALTWPLLWRYGYLSPFGRA
jgi:hypothetical protein